MATEIKKTPTVKETKPDYLKDYKEPTFEFDLIPGVNEAPLDNNISIN